MSLEQAPCDYGTRQSPGKGRPLRPLLGAQLSIHGLLVNIRRPPEELTTPFRLTAQPHHV